MRSSLVLCLLWLGFPQDPLKQLSSTQKSDARMAVLGEGKAAEAAFAKVRSVGPLSKQAAEDFARKFVFPVAPQKAGVRKRTIKLGSAERDYTLRVPATYHPARPVPLILSLHGAGGNGEGEYSWMWAAEAERWPGLIACPSGQPPGGQWFPEQEEFLLAVYRDLQSSFNIDANRVYLGGFSNGGNGTWFHAQNHPWLFAAACPRGGGNPTGQLENLLHLGVYIIHGEKDATIPCDGDRRDAARLKELKYDVVYVEVPDGGHEPFHKETPKVLEFFTKHVRNPWVKKVKFSGRREGPDRIYWVEVTKPSGTARVSAEVTEGNRIALEVGGASEICLHLSDALVDLDKPVVVTLNGAEVHSGPVPRTLEAIVTDLRATRDPSASSSARLVLEVK